MAYGDLAGCHGGAVVVHVGRGACVVLQRSDAGWFVGDGREEIAELDTEYEVQGQDGRLTG